MHDLIRSTLAKDSTSSHSLSEVPTGDLPNKEIPIFMGHGYGDPKVKWNWGQRSKEWLEKEGWIVDFRTYSKLFHAIGEVEKEDLRVWIEGVLSGEGDMSKYVNE